MRKVVTMAQLAAARAESLVKGRSPVTVDLADETLVYSRGELSSYVRRIREEFDPLPAREARK